RREVDLHGRHAHAVAIGAPCRRGHLRRRKHGLRRHTPVVIALAAELVTLSDSDSQAGPRASERERDLGAGAAPSDHEDVEALHAPPIDGNPAWSSMDEPECTRPAVSVSRFASPWPRPTGPSRLPPVAEPPPCCC